MRRGADAVGRVPTVPLERHGRLTSGLRRPAGPVSLPSSRSTRFSGEPAEPSRAPAPAASHQPSRLAARLARGWCAALLALALLPAAGAAQAQTERVLVSNIGGPTASTSVSLGAWQRIAQGFTTGSARHDYTLTSVDVDFYEAPPTDVSVRVLEGTRTGTIVATLTNPSSLTAGTLTFTAPAGTTLDANSTYFVVIETTSFSGGVNRTHSAEDAGGATGWAIGDGFSTFRFGGWSGQSAPIKIRVNGYEIPDTFGPELQAAGVDVSNRKKIHLAFDEPLDPRSIPDTRAFTAKVDGSPVSVSPTDKIVVRGNTVTVTLANAVAETTGDPATPPTVTVSYNKVQAEAFGDRQPLQDVLGNKADSFSNQTVRSNNRKPSYGATAIYKKTNSINAPSGTLISLNYDPGRFTDPDGDAVTVTQTVNRPDAAAEITYSGDPVYRVFLMHKGACALANLDPPIRGNHTTTVTYRATDPYGATSDPVTLNYVMNLPSNQCPEITGASVDGTALVLTFTINIIADSEGDRTITPSGLTASEFTVTADGEDVDVSSVSIGSSTDTAGVRSVPVTLTLAESVWAGQTAKVSHLPTGTLTTGRFTDQAVTVSTTNHRPTITAADSQVQGRNAPPGQLVSAEMTIADPDITSGLTLVAAEGVPTDASTVNVWVTANRPGVANAANTTFVGPPPLGPRAYFSIKTQDELCALDSPPEESFETTFTVTATDSDGATSAPVEIVATTAWEPDDCEPTLETAVVDVRTLTLTFSKALDEDSVPAATAFAVTAAGSARTVDEVAVSGSKVVLTLSSKVSGGETVTVGYAKPSSNPLRGADAPQQPVDSFSGQDVTNNTPPPPGLQSAAVYGTVLQMTFSETPLDTTPAARPAPGAFAVMVEGVRRNVASVSVAAETVRLGLVSAVRPGERVTVAYDRPASGAALRNALGFEARSFNSADSGTPDVTHATPVTPAVRGAEVRGDVVTVTFDRALDPDRRPSAGRFTVEQYFRVYAAVPVRRVEIHPTAPDKLVLILTRSVRTGAVQYIRMRYAQGGDGNALRGPYGLRVRDFDGVTVVNNTPVPKFGSPGTESYAQVGPNVNDSACGRYRPGVTLEESAAGYMYVCDTSQRQWTLAGHAVPGVDYRANGEIDWTLVADWYAGTGRCVLRGYDDLAEVWRLMSTPSQELCDRARMKAASEGGVVSLSISLAEPVAAPTANAFKRASPTANAFKRASPAANALKSVAFRTDGGTATPGLDYRPTQGRLVFGPGEHTKTVQVQTLRDGESEEPETVGLRLFDARGFTLSPASSELVVTIQDGASTDEPVVTGVAIASDPGADATYGLGDTVRVRVAFDQAVSVDTAGGTPGLTIDMDPADWGAKRATYESGSGTAALVFAFGPVASPNVSTRGVAVLAGTLETGGGTIRSVSKGVDALLDHAGLDHDPAHRVDWALSSNRAPVVDEGSRHYASFTASGNAPRGTLVSKQIHGIFSDPDGDDLTYTVTLADDGQAGLVDLLHVTTEADLAASPHPIDVILRVWFQADAEADWDAMDPAVPDPVAIPVTLTATDPGGLTASVEGVFQTGWGPPRVQSVAVVSDAGPESTYALGDVIRFAVTFGDPVTVDTSGGVPRLAIDMDPAEWGTKHAAWESGSGTTELVFAYEVVEPNISTQGIAVLADSLEANGGTIRLASALRSSAPWMTADLRHPGLPHDPDHKVDWRPALTVADAEANEGTDAAVDFEVSLSRAFTTAAHSVTVDYATADGTAKAGEDYTATSGTLTFGPGESSKTVSVPILDDALDEGEETFVLRLSNATGGRIVDGEATGTITNSDPLQKMWLSRFGRTVADHVTAAVSDRLANPLTGAQVTVGGQTMNLAELEDDAFLGRTLTSIAQVMGAPSGSAPANGDPGAGLSASDPGHAGAEAWPGTNLGAAEAPTLASASARSVTGGELLLGSAFHLAMDGEGAGPGLAAWGRVTAGRFDGQAPGDAGDVRIDGDVMTGILGTDAEWGRVLAGVALSLSEGEGTFDWSGVDAGSIESTMTTVSPYARVTLSERLSAWGLAGIGTGDMTVVQAANAATGQPERMTRTDLAMRLAAMGGRGALLTPDQAGGFDLALRGDAFFVETESEAVAGEGATTADASRVRLILEGSRAFVVGDGVITPGLELGLRHDGGDAETGTGVEVGGRIAWADPETGLSMEANVRALVAHEDAGYEEWGASGALRLAPGDAGRGLSFSLAPTYGAPSSGVDRLWSARDAGGFGSTGGTFEPESRLAGELGYGIALPGGFMGTPNLGFAVANGARDYRAGWRLAPAGAAGFEVNLDATRRESVNLDGGDAAPVEHGVLLRGALRW